jgi:hypothetical protein
MEITPPMSAHTLCNCGHFLHQHKVTSEVIGQNVRMKLVCEVCGPERRTIVLAPARRRRLLGV